MLESIKKEWTAKVAALIFFVFILWWVYLQFIAHSANSPINQWFSGTYGVMALLGGVWGVSISLKWGGFKSIFGRAILMFSVGLLLQEFGQIAYSLYYISNVEVPYPSIGDLGYFFTIPAYIYGVYLLGKAAGVKIHVQSFFSKIQALVIPLILLLAAYLFFLKGYEFDWTHPVRIFLDFGYPMGEAIYISLALVTYLLSRGVLGGMMKSKIFFLLFALVVQFCADYLFLFQSKLGTFTPAGISDFVYLYSYFIMALALIQLNTVLKKLSHS